ncbi:MULTISPECIES: GAF domain-containing protein [Vreelandella]|jgi:GAF domain-containing protein|uniref:GAF domain-containing protein n=2 Tax=Vreelandella TaxID=3137766 RepID=A0A7C9NY06_9GAMM|nr:MULTISPECIES: GAF domain-containing protein [Halomonas]NDL71771.1 GAF domain-containing protein [Halomonas alkaliphila]NYS45739.1 GAF domain-containing protein [Halomonas zhaodongensis]
MPRVDYALLNRQLASLLDTRDWLTNCAQTCAFIQHALDELNWVGFYLHRQPNQLCLGPFQGKPACHPIPFSKGVCGAAARQQATQRIDDVHTIADHIACDAASRSELVVPIMADSHLWGVLDLDSPQHGRFSQEDQAGIEAFVATFIRQTDLPHLIE